MTGHSLYLMCIMTLPVGHTAANAQGEPVVQNLPPVVVKADKPGQDSGFDSRLTAKQGLAAQQVGQVDSAGLLKGVPGVSVYGAGGLSSLPAINGLADERVRIQVNGMDLMAACPNHMNSPLSYIDPSEIAEIKVHAGVTPVSVGGDSLGGTIEVKDAPPAFANAEQGRLNKGQVGMFARSNGNARGANVQASTASPNFFLQYLGNTARADNYTAARGFKPETPGTEGGAPLPADEVGSSAYHHAKHDVGMAWRHDIHLLRLNVAQHLVHFEGFPNQRMDMTGNRNTTVNLRYKGMFDWADIEARAFTQLTRHAMDMGPDRYTYGTGMPMRSKATTAGGQLMATHAVDERDTLRAGAEVLQHNLFDWWPPVGGTMGPRTFWNIDNGRRNRASAFIEWDRSWDAQWSTQLGLRHDQILSDAGAVQGYDNGLGATWGNDAAAFNARTHRHVDRNWDFTALSTLRASAQQSWSFGFARKTRSPSLYQRYPWSTNTMAALMNNFVGDGNGYVGNEDLKPEVAHTASVNARWQGEREQDWHLRLTAHVTDVQDYIDAKRCDIGSCSLDALNQTARNSFVRLQYINQRARLHGLTASGERLLATLDEDTRLGLNGQFSLTRGSNRTTGEPLYQIAPPQLKLGLNYRSPRWTHTAEWQAAQGKHRVSAVRNEVSTAGYALLNLASSLAWRDGQLDMRIDNLLDRFYQQALGGAYIGQGASMTTNGMPWGVAMPGMGRSFTLALTLKY